MKYIFLNRKLEQLYATGRSSKYKLDKNILKDFIWLVGVIASAKDIHDFWNQPALNFERLKGRRNRYSFRITRKYRLEVEIDWENEEQTIGIIGIAEISRHYQ